MKLKCGVLLSTSAFKFNLRRYDMDVAAVARGGGGEDDDDGAAAKAAWQGGAG